MTGSDGPKNPAWNICHLTNTNQHRLAKKYSGGNTTAAQPQPLASVCHRAVEANRSYGLDSPDEIVDTSTIRERDHNQESTPNEVAGLTPDDFSAVPPTSLCSKGTWRSIGDLKLPHDAHNTAARPTSHRLLPACALCGF